MEPLSSAHKAYFSFHVDAFKSSVARLIAGPEAQVPAQARLSLAFVLDALRSCMIKPFSLPTGTRHDTRCQRLMRGHLQATRYGVATRLRQPRLCTKPPPPPRHYTLSTTVRATACRPPLACHASNLCSPHSGAAHTVPADRVGARLCRVSPKERLPRRRHAA